MKKLLLSTIVSLLLNFSFSYQPVTYREIYFAFENSLSVDIISTVVTNVDAFDWPDPNGPLLEFQDLEVPAKGAVNITAKCNREVEWLPFTMTHAFSDGTRAKFRYYLKVVEPFDYYRHILDGNRDVDIGLLHRYYDAVSAYLTIK
ncbi:hypothetical protein Zmor_005006 [Zophobas morio]|uniref:Uncharacterized protein n=1 Tax=Zophobas morio TaxID=2755281 RepID=A0AA38MLJ9_9CUCU|nr:hypothetical protein Zmor_005006 [Zophobas morio]